MSTPFWIASTILAISMAVVLGISFKNSRELLFNPVASRQQRYQADPEKHPHFKFAEHGVQVQKCDLMSRDGVHINAWYVPARIPAAVVLVHGYKMDSGEMAPVAAMLVENGFGVIIPDLRGHGDSDGELITFGHHEWQDIEAAIDYVVEHQPEVHVGIFGNSMGGALSICYAARDPRVEAISAQSPYASVRHSLKQGIKYFTGLPAFPFVPLIRMFSLPFVNLDSPDISPLVMMTRLNEHPVLILMGGADVVVEPDGGEMLYQAGGANTRLWYEPELGHVEFQSEKPEAFKRRVVGFFRTNLLPYKSTEHI